MSKQDLQGEDQVLDPIVAAAMADEDDDDEEEKKRRAEALGIEEDDDTEEDTPEDKAEDKTEESDEDSDEDKEAEDEGEQADSETDEDSDEADKVAKPTEAQDDEESEVPTRKDKREARQKAFMDNIYRQTNQGQRIDPSQLQYQPLDYKAQDEFKPEDLEQDRDQYGNVQYAKGVEEARYWAEQDNFWKETEFEQRILAVDPKMNFLSQTTPDGQANPNYDARKAKTITDMYLNMVGYKEFYRTDPQGQIQYDQTGQPLKYATVDRTDISYEKFARAYVQEVEDWLEQEIDEELDQQEERKAKRSKNRSIKSTGGKKRGRTQLSPGVIANMTDEELEEQEGEIDAEINRMLGL